MELRCKKARLPLLRAQVQKPLYIYDLGGSSHKMWQERKISDVVNISRTLEPKASEESLFQE